MNSDKLVVDGWCDFVGDYENLAEMILECGSALGCPIPSRGQELVQKLCPIASEAANPRSLSALFGQGALPLHVDTAHWPTPCRYVVLACVEPGSDLRPTLLLDTNKLGLTEAEHRLLNTTTFRIRNGRRSFYGTILSADRSFVRYDPGCMEPVCSSGERALKVLTAERWSQLAEKVVWHKGRVLVIDNWRMLHGRASTTRTNDSSRKLLRVLVK